MKTPLRVRPSNTLVVLFCVFVVTGVLRLSAAYQTPSQQIELQGLHSIGNPHPFSFTELKNVTNLNAWQAANWLGQGRKIGIIDAGFSGLVQFVSVIKTVGIPTSHNITEYDAQTTTHGTQILEIIHSIVPEAELYACSYTDLASFSYCVDWMISQDLDIINHSAGVPALPLDGSNVWAAKVEDAAQHNILWVNAAGNYGTGLYEDRFFIQDDLNPYHEFRVNDIDDRTRLFIDGLRNPGTIYLSWRTNEVNERANEIDLDLEIIPAGEHVPLDQGNTRQNGGDSEAIERVMINFTTPFSIRIRSQDGNTRGVEFVLFVPYTDLPDHEARGSIIAPADSPYALSVGATQGNRIADYSSRGLLDSQRIAPDLVAPGGVYLSDGTPVEGTSVSAPIVAAAAALISQAHPDYLPQEIIEYLKRDATLDDSEFEGDDYVYGAGYLFLPDPELALTSSDAVTPTTPTRQEQIGSTSTASSPIAHVLVPSANLREGPNVAYKPVAYVVQNDELVVQGKIYDWYAVEYNADTVWIAGSVIAITPEDAVIPDWQLPVVPLPPTLTPLLTPTFLPTWTPNPFNPPPATPSIDGVVFVTRIVTTTPTYTPSFTATSTSTSLTATATPSQSSLFTNTPTASATATSAFVTFSYAGFATVRNAASGINIRRGPNREAQIVGSLSCTYRVATLSGGILNADGETWYYTGQGYIYQEVITIYNSYQEADAAATQICHPTPTHTATLSEGGSGNSQIGTESNEGGQIVEPPPPIGLSITFIDGPGTAASGGCRATGNVSGPSDIGGILCIAVEGGGTYCDYPFSGPGGVYLDLGGVGKNHSVYANTNYGRIESSMFCPAT